MSAMIVLAPSIILSVPSRMLFPLVKIDPKNVRVSSLSSSSLLLLLLSLSLLPSPSSSSNPKSRKTSVKSLSVRTLLLPSVKLTLVGGGGGGAGIINGVFSSIVVVTGSSPAPYPRPPLKELSYGYNNSLIRTSCMAENSLLDTIR